MNGEIFQRFKQRRGQELKRSYDARSYETKTLQICIFNKDSSSARFTRVFLFLYISQSFSFFQRREMTCFIRKITHKTVINIVKQFI